MNRNEKIIKIQDGAVTEQPRTSQALKEEFRSQEGL